MARPTSTIFLHKKFTMPKPADTNKSSFLAKLAQLGLRPSVCGFSGCALIGALALGTFFNTAVAQILPPTAVSVASESLSDATPVIANVANFGREESSPESRKLADWVMDSANNNKLPFIIVDKARARVFVFDAQGQLKGASTILLGLAVGDDSVPGIGQRKLSTIRPAERTTPAGRFVASLDRDVHGEEVLWVDYDTAVSMHRVATGQPKERRLERLASSSLLDKRISYGCINVPVKFYEKVVSPTFTGTNGIVYVLPETRSAREVFGSYDVQDSLRGQTLPSPAQASNSVSR